MDWIITNREWLFSGIGLVVLVFIIKFIRNFTKPESTIDNDLSIGYIEQGKFQDDYRSLLKLDNSNNDFSYLKDHIRILFIDDDTKFKIIKILNKTGWKTKIVKDIDNLDADVILNNHIFFVDINGVGVKLDFKDEGLGLASAIKQKYPDKKVIIYSSDQEGNRFHKGLRSVDDFLPKNAEPFEFQQIIENFSSEIEV